MLGSLAFALGRRLTGRHLDMEGGEENLDERNFEDLEE